MARLEFERTPLEFVFDKRWRWGLENEEVPQELLNESGETDRNKVFEVLTKEFSKEEKQAIQEGFNFLQEWKNSSPEERKLMFRWLQGVAMARNALFGGPDELSGWSVGQENPDPMPASFWDSI